MRGRCTHSFELDDHARPHDVQEAVSTATADSGNTFRYDSTSGQYIFNLATSGLSTGTWQLTIDTHDGNLHSVSISLK